MDRQSSKPLRSHFLRPIVSMIERCKAFLKKFSKRTVVQVPNQEEDQQNGSLMIEPTREAAHLDLEQGELDQVQCPLLSMLPADVRLMIYSYILCSPGPVVHIVTRHDGNLGTYAPFLNRTSYGYVKSQNHP